MRLGWTQVTAILTGVFFYIIETPDRSVVLAAAVNFGDQFTITWQQFKLNEFPNYFRIAVQNA